MNNSKQDKRNRFFTEVALNLRCGGFTVGEPNEDTLPVELNGQRLCQVTDSGAVRYWKEDVTGNTEAAALDKVIDIAKATAEYMSLMESAPQLTVGSLEGDYRLLADFSGTILAGHQTQYGVQFVTWERSHDRTSLEQGHYYGPGGGADSYAAAKRDFGQ